MDNANFDPDDLLEDLNLELNGIPKKRKLPKSWILMAFLLSLALGLATS